MKKYVVFVTVVKFLDNTLSKKYKTEPCMLLEYP